MTYHRTKSGHIEFLDEWGRGKAPSGNWTRRPATLTAQDDDGHYEAWQYSGRKADAALRIAELMPTPCDHSLLWKLAGDHVSPVEYDDWAEGVEEVERDEDGEAVGEFRYHPERHPGGLCVR